ncbi:hypothetical protein ACQEUU_22350 [Nonomuraea sp. CA-218870]
MITPSEPEYPGDVHWYDLPDDEAELEETPAPVSRLRRFIPFIP